MPSINFADENYVKTNGNATLNGNITVNCSSSRVVAGFINSTGGSCHIRFGSNIYGDCGIIQFGGAAQDSFVLLGMYGFDNIILYNRSAINLNKNTTITGNLTVTGTITGKTNTTITHYAPVEEPIANYHIGKPVFLSGNVYKQYDTEWIPSCTADTTDCICSVKSTGTWKEFVGVIISIDEENNCITFATHGDFLFSVDNTKGYQVGDVVLYDGTVLQEDATMTLKVQQSLVGKVTGKIDEKTLAIFKS